MQALGKQPEAGTLKRLKQTEEARGQILPNSLMAAEIGKDKQEAL